MHYTYLLTLLFTLSYPLFKSFENKISFSGKWKFLFPAILISAGIFIAWDIWFTTTGVWGFDPGFVIGFYIFKLPIEEWLFFFIVPYSCVFIYEVMNYFVKKDLPNALTKIITIILISALLIIAATNIDKIYTAVTFIALASFLGLHLFILRSDYIGRFYIAWAVCTIPFLIINGFLTSTVLIYDNMKNLNIRIYTIPLEDYFYGMLQILLVITVYEFFKRKISAS